MGFPPGLIPQLVRVKADTDPPYSPLSPLDIERAGLPSPAEPDAYLASRLDRFYAELRVRLPLEPLACSVVDVQRSDAMSQDACTIEQELQDVMDRFWVVHLSQASYQLKVAHLRHVQTYLAFITLHKPSSLSHRDSLFPFRWAVVGHLWHHAWCCYYSPICLCRTIGRVRCVLMRRRATPPPIHSDSSCLLWIALAQPPAMEVIRNVAAAMLAQVLLLLVFVMQA